MVWALLGAWAFRATEGPHERQRASGVRLEQQKLADELAEAARRLAEDGGACGDDTAWRDAAQTAWRAAARQYVVRHEQMLLDAVDDGFGEGGGGYIWTFSGCLLFAVSLLTTLV
ncbi:Uncharacterized protein GBIM_14286 [Gryllus bimaculatus]|nr:Uncharacterized protein GBIM_14286 [Gryllus bimaculatus]